MTRRAGCSPANEGPTAIAPASRARISRTAASNGLRIVTRASDSAAPTTSRDGKGRVYFTDRPANRLDQTGINAVYRIDPGGVVAQILKEPEIERPNGIVISPDDKILYLIEAHIAKEAPS